MALNLNKLTEKSGGLLQRSQEIAAGKNNQLIEPEHLFAAMLEDNDSIINSILFALKSDKEALANGNSRCSITYRRYREAVYPNFLFREK